MMFIIKEKIYGNMATVFHRTKISDLVNKVFDSGFKPGSGDIYGKGFYSTYELKSQLKSYTKNAYGPIIVKFACPIQTFFIFDYEEFKKSPNFKKLNSPTKKEFLKSQFEFFKMDYSKFDFSEMKNKANTSKMALWCCKNISNFTKLCEGIVYTDSKDGHCLLAYNTKLITPLSYTLNDGETWEKVELNLDYLKKVAKVKNRFVVDLSSKPEEFGIENYEFDKDGFLNVGGDIDLYGKNLKEIPFKFGTVDGSFSCNFNNITTLNGAPKMVKNEFDCSFNKLTSLEGCSKEILYGFDCSNNNLTTLKGSPEKVGGDFNCKNNKAKFTKEDVEKVCKVRGKIIV